MPRFDTCITWASIHPSRDKGNQRKKQLMPRFDTGITLASIHPGTKEIKEKNNLCKGLIQVSHGHPSIQEQMKSKKKTIYAKV
jgi:hypothetical protein